MDKCLDDVLEAAIDSNFKKRYGQVSGEAIAEAAFYYSGCPNFCVQFPFVVAIFSHFHKRSGK